MQIITDNGAFNLPFDSIYYNDKQSHIEIGDCIFSLKGIKLSINNQNLIVKGKLKFSMLTPIRYDIMGPFKLVPFMQCRHAVYSMRHRVDGQLTVNNKRYIFRGGTGYIEGDSGCSFPSRYIWTQCFFPDGSLMLSAADIPFMGFNFTGIIGIILIGGKEYRLATYLGAKIRRIGNNLIQVSQGDFELIAKLIEKNSYPLFAPDGGKMSRTIHESASCKAYYRFSHKGKILCEFTSDTASFEYEFDTDTKTS